MMASDRGTAGSSNSIIESLNDAGIYQGTSVLTCK